MAALTLKWMGQPSIYHATVSLSFQIEICNLDRTKSSFLATSLYKKSFSPKIELQGLVAPATLCFLHKTQMANSINTIQTLRMTQKQFVKRSCLTLSVLIMFKQAIPTNSSSSIVVVEVVLVIVKVQLVMSVGLLCCVLKTLFSIVEARLKKKLNFDVCVAWWCSDGPINCQKYKSFEIYAVTIKISMTEYYHWINGQAHHLF